MSEQVRVRYAPSPTGEPHVGNIRTAIFNWLYARHTGGSFIVRVEDTDVQRRVKGATEAILKALRWLGLDWDEGPEVGGPYGPYFQSERLPPYQEAAECLIRQGDAYYCYCSPERLQDMRQEQQRRRESSGYDRRCRDLSQEQAREGQPEGTVPVVRLKMPLDGETVVQDYVRGEVRFENRLLDDFVILKSDGYPTYHLASVVDDHLMEISHVMRAEEWLSSTPRHWRLYDALGYERPVFVHLPIILGPDRAKLSKRHGATSALAYQKMGYLPEAMLNFLSLLGWSLDDRTELLSPEELVRHFSLDRIGDSAAVLDQEKLEWMNGVYIRQLSTEELADRLTPFLQRGLPVDIPRPLDSEYLLKIGPLVQERLKTLAEGPDLTSFFFESALIYDLEDFSRSARGLSPEHIHSALATAMERLQRVDPFDAAGLESLLRPLAEELGLKTGQLFGALRVATTGRTAAPPLFQTMEVLGKERCLLRVGRAIGLLKGGP